MRRLLLALLITAGAPGALAAQSLFAARGLGVPVEPVDARSRLLGGTGVGLLGVNPSLVNPAELAGTARRGVAASLQPSSYRIRLGEEEESVGSTRFPLIALLYPLSPRLTLGFGYGAYLDQSWGLRTSGVEVIGGTPVDVEDVIRSTGGLTQLRVSGAYQLSPSLSLGLAGGVVTGSLERHVTRTFDDSTGVLVPFSTRLRWEYGGFLGSAGVQFQPLPVVELAASITMTSDLDADSVSGGSFSRSYGSALTIAAGASAQLTTDLLVALSGSRQRYPEIDGPTDAGRETWAFGGGIEYAGLQWGRRTLPLRAGARWQQLPYYGAGEEPASELATGLGLGIRLAGDATGPLAVVDAGLERVTRSGLESALVPGGLEESLWRWTVSLSLFGR